MHLPGSTHGVGQNDIRTVMIIDETKVIKSRAHMGIYAGPGSTHSIGQDVVIRVHQLRANMQGTSVRRYTGTLRVNSQGTSGQARPTVLARMS